MSHAGSTLDAPMMVRPAESREPVLDGIRALAILAVLFHHFVSFSGMSAVTSPDELLLRVGLSGWIGVDLFFVLSGYLITGILYDSKSSPGYFRNFYLRRALRIFPLYYCVLIASLYVAPLFIQHSSLDRLAEDQAWYWLYVSNIQVALEGWQRPMHMGHFWSLAVEEQFYLIWPLVVLALDRRRLLWVSAGCFLVALVLRFALPLWLPPVANYVLMPTRMDALAAGAIVALMIRGEQGQQALRGWSPMIVFACLGLVIVVSVGKGGLGQLDPFVRTFGYSVLALGFGALIAWALTSSSGSVIRRLLSAPWLGPIAKYSYAMYVFHQPVTVFLRHAGLDATILPPFLGSEILGVIAFGSIAAILTCLLSLTSWRLVEAPALSFRSRLGRSSDNRATRRAGLMTKTGETSSRQEQRNQTGRRVSERPAFEKRRAAMPTANRRRITDMPERMTDHRT